MDLNTCEDATALERTPSSEMFPETGCQRHQIEQVVLDLENINIDSPSANPDTSEELPNYDAVMCSSVSEGVENTNVSENLRAASKDTEAGREDTETGREDALIGEAPPNYRHLFGDKQTSGQKSKCARGTSGSGDEQGPIQQLIARLERNKIASTFVVSGIIIFILVLPLAMIIIGALNVKVCNRHEIPLYLMVAGSILIAEIVFQTSLCIAIKRNKRHESTYRALRMCDCLALFLFIWLLVGTYWMFTISLTRQRCINYSSDGMHVNTTIVSDTETQVSVSPTSTTMTSGDGTTSVSCPDCDGYVYNYAAFVIMLQYIIALGVIIFCCLFYIRVRGQR